MKQKIKKTLLILFCIICSISVNSQTFDLGDIRYNITSADSLTVEVIANEEVYTGEITIPSSVNYNGNTYSVTAIGEKAFYWSEITGIKIPESVTTIKDEAFSASRNLTSIEIPNSVTNLGKEAFYACGITKLVIGNGITSIDEATFRNCTDLVDLTWGSNIHYIGEGAFDNCKSLPEIIIPKSVTAIGPGVFVSCTSALKVVIPATVTEIGDNTFMVCESLQEFYNYSEVPQTIGEWMFYSVNMNTCILYVPSNSVDAYKAAQTWNTFKNIEPIAAPQFVVDGIKYNITSADSLTVEVIADEAPYTGEITLPSSVNYNDNTYSVTAIANNAFYNGTISTINIPTSVKYIGEEAFGHCNALTSIEIPESVTSLGEGAFRSCENATKVTIPASLTTFSNNVFTNCYALKEIYNYCEVPQEINSWTFYQADLGGCTLYVPNGTVDSYKNASFWNSCGTIKVIGATDEPQFVADGIKYNITSADSMTVEVIANEEVYTGEITIPSSVIYNDKTYSVTAIGEKAFYKSVITQITIPESVTTIKKEAFYDCDNLASVEIPNSVTNLENSAFESCNGLTKIVIGDGLTSISEATFIACSKLVDITWGRNIHSLERSSFEQCSSLKEIIIPESITNISSNVFASCGSVLKVVIPATTEIGANVFMMCSSLREFYNYREEPQAIGEWTFYNVNTDSCTLYVPNSSIDAYKAAQTWNTFKNIEPIILDGIEATNSNEVNVSVVDNQIIISGSSDATPVNVYNVNGKLIYNGSAKAISVPSNNVYIVKVAGITKKVIL